MTDRRNGCMGLIDLLFDRECDLIAEECSREGYPSHGSNYDLRCEDLWNSYYSDWYNDAASYL